MISKDEILALRAEWSLRDDVIEKDYVLGWLLAGIVSHSELRDHWIFKGGTALRKCYFETYRFSEDLDFTVIEGGPEAGDELARIFGDISATVADLCGIEFKVELSAFRAKKNRRGNPTTEGRLAYRGPRMPPNLPKVKLDLTSDEIIVTETVLRPIFHPFSDALPDDCGVRCYSLVDLAAEKLRALAERCRPRDLYDVIHIYQQPAVRPKALEVRQSLQAKCQYVGIEEPTYETIVGSKYRQEIEDEWTNMLGHQLPQLPAFEKFWGRLDELFDWLRGESQPTLQRRAELPYDRLDDWVPPRSITSWRIDAPLELVRFAGANRLRVRLDYAAPKGRQGWRSVEPYAIRRTKKGDLLLYVVNDRDQLRSYRLDRIRGAEVTADSFTPRFVVEF